MCLLLSFSANVLASNYSTQTSFDINNILSLNNINAESGLNAFSNDYIPSDFFVGARSSIQESEPNDNMTYADVIYDDYNVYGILGNNIGGGNEFDYYKLTISTPGIVNFWINCDSSNDLYQYMVLDSERTVLGVTTYSNKLVTLDLQPGTYYVLVYGDDGYSNPNATYLFRTKLYYHYELDVPFHEQETTWTCGSACAIMILEHLGITVLESDFRNVSNNIDITNAYNIAQRMNYFLEENLYESLYVGGYTQSEYTDKIALNLQNNHPVIALLKINSQSEFQYNSEGHYVVVRGITYNSSTQKYTAIINDPHYNYPEDNLYVKMDNVYNMTMNHSGFMISAD
jgi:hypothetical protein